jgi:hypothetical protein
VLRLFTLVMIVLLSIQLLIGVYVNLFVTIPKKHPGTDAPGYFSGVVQSVMWAVFQGGTSVAAHAVLGLLLVLSALVVLVCAVASRRGSWIVAGIIGLFATLGAGFNGASFLIFHEDISSMIMSIGFAVAVVAYAAALYSRPAID